MNVAINSLALLHAKAKTLLIAMATGLLRNALFAAILITAATATATRSRRRAPVNNIQPISLEELLYSCSVQGWTSCQDMATSLLDTEHGINVNIQECLHQNYPFELTTSLPTTAASLPTSTSAIYTNIEDRNDNIVSRDPVAASGSGSGAEPSPSPSPSPIPVPEPTASNGSRSEEAPVVTERCTVTGVEKRRVRRDVYCRQLFHLDAMLNFLIPGICLLRDFEGCVSYFRDPGYLTPHQLVESIKQWHKDMISTHKGCCESQDEIFTRDLDSLYGNQVIRIGENVQGCPFINARHVWDSKLSRVTVLVHMLELMQDLGRRRTCLRGCVNEGQVVCSNLLPYML